MSNITNRRPGIELLFPGRRVCTAANPVLRYLLFAVLGPISIQAVVLALALSAVLLGFVLSRPLELLQIGRPNDSQRGSSDDGESIAGSGVSRALGDGLGLYVAVRETACLLCSAGGGANYRHGSLEMIGSASR